MFQNFFTRRFAIALAFASALALALAGCDQEAMLQRMVPQEEAALAKELVAKIAAKDFTAVDERLASNLRTPEARAQLEQLATLLPPERPKSIRVVGSHTMSKSETTTYDLTFEYEYPQRWLLVNTVLQKRNGKLTLEGIHLTPIAQSLETINRFTFDGKGIPHYLVFVFAIVIPAFVIYALIMCVRTKLPRRKWLWLLFVAFGVVQFKFDWTTGAWAVQPIAFLFLGGGFAKMGPVAPYIFTLAFPLGAIAFMVKRRSLLSANDATPLAQADVPSALNSQERSKERHGEEDRNREHPR
ncbi:MAG: hypothetical protein KIS62_09930 [Ramlibacter sp.]|nr:hypothetical protein [Ramlibacter sp.]